MLGRSDDLIRRPGGPRATRSAVSIQRVRFAPGLWANQRSVTSIVTNQQVENQPHGSSIDRNWTLDTLIQPCLDSSVPFPARP